MNETPNYYAIITADVRYDKRLTPNAKLLYAEITALCQKEGYCFATNKYFQELYGVSQQTVSAWVKQLVDCGYITIEMNKKTNQRYIRLLVGGIQKNLYSPLQKNLYHNNINNNNKYNNNKTILIETGKFFLDDTIPEYKKHLNGLSDEQQAKIGCWILDNMQGQYVSREWVIDRINQFKSSWGL